MTVGPELDFDYYGYMTYMVPNISPGTSVYKYAYYLSQGKRVHGLQFQRWIGWLGDPKSEEDPNVIENPFIYDSVIQQYKIALSFGFDEVVIAPVRNFLGRDQLEGINRLQTLIDIRNNGYDAIELQITNNMRLVNDFPLWIEKIHPVYWLSNEKLFRDLMMGTYNSWFFLAHLSTFLTLSLCSVWAIKYKNKGNNTIYQKSS